MNTVSEMFNQSYNKIDAKIAFSKDWKNGTGYLDKLVDANVGLRSGECAVTVDDFKRRIIVIGTPVGNVALFERYTPTWVLNTTNGSAEYYASRLTDVELKSAREAIEATGVYHFPDGSDSLNIDNFEVKRSSVIVGNYPAEIEKMFGSLGGIGSSLQPEGFERLFHSSSWNIGKDLDTLTRQFARAAQPKVKLQQVEVETMLQPGEVTMENIHDIIKFTNPSINAIADQHPVLKGVLYFHAGFGQYAKSIEEHAKSIEARFGEEFKVLLETKDYPAVASRVIEITCDDLTNTLEYATAFKGLVSPLGKATSQVMLRSVKRNAGRIGGLVGACVKFGMEVKAEVAATKKEIAMLKEVFSMASDTDGAVKH
jgi:hypothetical protein